MAVARWDTNRGPIPPGYMQIEPVGAAALPPGFIWIETVETAMQQARPDLDVDALPDKRTSNKKFRLEYTDLADLQHRLARTLIRIKGNPFYVWDIRGERRGFTLVVQNRHGKQNLRNILYNHEMVDCSPIPPQYIQYAGQTYFMYRVPNRQQQQGTSGNNTYIKHIVKGYTDNIDPLEIIPAVEDTSVEPFSREMGSFMKRRFFEAARLSPKVAIMSEDGTLKVHFRGRSLGTLDDGGVQLDSFDMRRPWIHKALAEVNLGIRS